MLVKRILQRKAWAQAHLLRDWEQRVYWHSTLRPLIQKCFQKLVNMPLNANHTESNPTHVYL